MSVLVRSMQSEPCHFCLPEQTYTRVCHSVAGRFFFSTESHERTAIALEHTLPGCELSECSVHCPYKLMKHETSPGDQEGAFIATKHVCGNIGPLLFASLSQGTDCYRQKLRLEKYWLHPNLLLQRGGQTSRWMSLICWARRQMTP